MVIISPFNFFTVTQSINNNISLTEYVCDSACGVTWNPDQTLNLKKKAIYTGEEWPWATSHSLRYFGWFDTLETASLFSVLNRMQMQGASHHHLFVCSPVYLCPLKSRHLHSLSAERIEIKTIKSFLLG